jgi:hypothetical protein
VDIDFVRFLPKKPKSTLSNSKSRPSCILDTIQTIMASVDRTRQDVPNDAMLEAKLLLVEELGPLECIKSASFDFE